MNISRTLCFYLIQRQPGIELAVSSSIALKTKTLEDVAEYDDSLLATWWYLLIREH